MSLDHVWLKGVPMELRPRYYPKPPLRFKDIDIYIPLDAIENDYDFTEERRVLVECKMWEEDKEKQRLAREEEERIRQLADAQERLRIEEQERLEREEAEAAGINNLIAQAELNSDESSNSNREKFIDQEISKLNLEESTQNSGKGNAASKVVNSQENNETVNRCSEDVNASGGVSGESAGNSFQESPTSEDNSVSSQSQSQSQPLVQSDVKDTLPSVAPVGMISQPPYPLMNGYQYNYPLYHQQQYYSYYMGVAPNPPVQYTPQAPGLPQQTGPIYPQQQMQTYQPVGVVQPPATVVAVAPAAETPTESSTVVSPSGPNVICEPSSKDSGTSSPTGDSDKSASVSNTASATTSSTAINQKVDLKDLSYFENDTTNPFDNVELKSINDMEVLASVLKNHSTPMNGSRQEPQTQPAAANSSYSHSNGGNRGQTNSGYYHQPTPLYPPVSTQCPYPAWNTTQQNGYYHVPPTSIAPPPLATASHIPSPTQAIDTQQPNTSTSTATTSAPITSTTGPAQASPATSVNSFTKLTFPFLTSMDASTSRYSRSPNGQPSGSLATPHNSQDDIASHNPFLSRYVQSTSHQHRSHQYWPMTQQPHGPPSYNSAISSGGAMGPLAHHHHFNHLASTSPISSPTPSTAGPTPATAGSQHALR